MVRHTDTTDIKSLQLVVKYCVHTRLCIDMLSECATMNLVQRELVEYNVT